MSKQRPVATRGWSRRLQISIHSAIYPDQASELLLHRHLLHLLLSRREALDHLSITHETRSGRASSPLLLSLPIYFHQQQRSLIEEGMVSASHNGLQHARILANPISLRFSALVLPFSFRRAASSAFALRTGAGSVKVRSGDALGSDFIRRPIVSPAKDLSGDSEGDKESKEAVKINFRGREEEDEDEDEEAEEDWVDWEDKILEDTVPLVGVVRMVLHSGRYQSGERLRPEHERTILEKLLPFHPEFEKKIGPGIDYITIGYHPEFQSSRCLFIVRKDGELVDFSYWKCVKGLIRKKYPLYADSFILRHFGRRQRTDGR